MMKKMMNMEMKKKKTKNKLIIMICIEDPFNFIQDRGIQMRES